MEKERCSRKTAEMPVYYPADTVSAFWSSKPITGINPDLAKSKMTRVMKISRSPGTPEAYGDQISKLPRLLLPGLSLQAGQPLTAQVRWLVC